MNRLQKPVRRMPFAWRMVLAATMAACLATIAHLATVEYLQRKNYARLRMEQQQLEAELQAVKRIAAGAEPVVVLENDQGTRVIMDLDSAIQPASLRTYD